MRKSTRMMSAIMVTVLAGSMLMTGCSQSSNEATQAATQAATKAPETAAPAATKAPETAAPAAEAVTLKLANWGVASNPYWQALADAYTAENPNVTFEMVDLGSADYTTQIITQMAGNDRPFDLVAIKDVAMYSDLIQKNLLLPVDESKIDTSHYNGNFDMYKWEGTAYTVPVRADFYCLWYNMDLFDAKGVPYPTNDMTYDEFYERVEAVADTSFGNEIYGVHLHHTWGNTYHGINGVLTERNNYFDGNFEYMKPAYEKMLELQEKGIIMDYASQKAAGYGGTAAFGDCKAAMIVNGSWLLGTYMTRIEQGQYPDLKRWGMALLPRPEGAEVSSTFSALAGVSAVAGAGHEEIAADFVRFCSTPEAAMVVAETGFFPGFCNEEVTEILLGKELAPKDDTTREAIAAAKGLMFDSPFGPNASELYSILNTGNDYIMTKTKTVDEGIAWMNEQVEKLGK